MTATAEIDCPPAFEWKRWPETDELLDEAHQGGSGGQRPGGCAREPDAARDRHAIQGLDRPPGVARWTALAGRLVELGYERQAATYAVGVPLFAHSGGMFPPIALEAAKPGSPDTEAFGSAEVAIKVESVADFSRRTTWACRSPVIRWGRTGWRGSRASERRWPWSSGAVIADSSLIPASWREGRMKPHAARDALAARDLWHGRRRRFDDDEAGIAATEATARAGDRARRARPIWRAT